MNKVTKPENKRQQGKQGQTGSSKKKQDMTRQNRTDGPARNRRKDKT